MVGDAHAVGGQKNQQRHKCVTDQFGAGAAANFSQVQHSGVKW